MAQVISKLPPLLDAVLAAHDGAYYIFDFMLYSTEQLQGDVGTAIGNNPVIHSLIGPENCPIPQTRC